MPANFVTGRVPRSVDMTCPFDVPELNFVRGTPSEDVRIEIGLENPVALVPIHGGVENQVRGGRRQYNFLRQGR